MRLPRRVEALPMIAPASQQKVNSAAVFMRASRVISAGRDLALNGDVHHLASDHAAVPPPSEPAISSQRTKGSPCASGEAIRSEGQREQRIAGENRGGLVEGLVQRGLAAPDVVISIAGRSSCTSE